MVNIYVAVVNDKHINEVKEIFGTHLIRFQCVNSLTLLNSDLTI